MSRKTWNEIDVNARKGFAAFFTRTQWEPTSTDMPFDALIAAEDAAELVESSEDAEVVEMRLMAVGARAMFEWLAQKASHPADQMRWLSVLGRALGAEPWATMTMAERAMMDSETTAAHSYRCKLLGKEFALQARARMRIAGQKTEAASESYKECRQGNTNRAPGIKINGTKHTTKQLHDDRNNF